MITRETKLNAVIGFPLDHTLSPALHNQIYQDNGLDVALLAFANPDAKALVDSIRALSIGLTAVTMPHKLAVIPYMDEVDEMARKIKAVNTIVNRDGKLYGYNTDISGVRRALATTELKDKNVLLIGAGGVARTIACQIEISGGRALYLNRTLADARILADEFGGQAVKSANKLKAEDIDVVINATPVGMYPNVDQSPLSENLLRANQTVMDVIYNPIQTKLLRQAQTAGAKTVFGLEMFVGQALEQVKLWQGKEVLDRNYIKFLEALI
ncbi:MAG: shikimate dehydrogenase [Candidatus Magasanikbacteria bacterium CG10_big_fil_rev_8_21_14_0_10_40_10]|uniref:Shikimate dehydrogenase (NADP(+)) n=1 Tax=Candidatus Magasanikbacteria bacterium CG10_big_fil_rev_8_21_14_0_10_40_10 TaxID=1974648 RepID=A0A2M6W428_9BACT|nr:MAG: shikimate dehydrogenase [Candidatus Magasanikbacteria bacterium CG10_big_fil_rev_8_21_14_0_10_40_10]